MDIADVRDRTGLSAAALHHYEKLGLIVSTERVGLRRQYNDEVIEILSVVALCQRSGFTLEEIGALIIDRNGSDWKGLARKKLDSIDQQISSLEQARTGLRHALECPNRNIMRCEHFRSSLDAIYPPADRQSASVSAKMEHGKRRDTGGKSR
jgi:DNA-binding transcriptional MerR regulator